MKRPLLNQDQREHIRLNTLHGAYLNLHLANMGIKRAAYKEGGYFHMRRVMKGVADLINYRLLNRYKVN